MEVEMGVGLYMVYSGGVMNSASQVNVVVMACLSLPLG